MTNEELNQFATIPTNNTLSRSVFNLSHRTQLTGKVGDLIPFECLEVIEGDTIADKLQQLVRTITPIFPTMDNAFLDIFFFYTPNRLCYIDKNFNLDKKIWEQICGENTNGFWKQTEEVEATSISLPNIEPQSVYDGLDFPVGKFLDNKIDLKINPSSVIAYGLIWNEFFRDQNVEAPIQDWENFLTKEANNHCLKVCKFKDYYTSALPQPQKHDPIEISLATQAPLKGTLEAGNQKVGLDTGTGRDPADFYLNFHKDNNGAVLRHPFGDGFEIHTFNHWEAGSNVPHNRDYTVSTDEDITTRFKTEKKDIDLEQEKVYADLSKAGTININDLRLSFALQKAYERDARSGTRYYEFLKSHYNIIIRDETIQRPEYLGGSRIPLNIEQVNQTSPSTETPLGFNGGYSLTLGKATKWTKSFKEKGWLIGVCCVRTSQTYKYGLPIKHTRFNRFDFYQPEMANIGEQPIRNKELFIDTTESGQKRNEEVFGYKEAWSEYRFAQNRLKGFFKTNDKTLNAWNYAQNLADTPTLNKEFLEQSREQFTKTLAVDVPDYDFIIDFWHDMKASRPLPTYSIPSLIDHR